ncbi:MAG: type II toxin-antitoxin system RelE/ParE family toxin [Burkholderiaceae bacterium]|uniref:type II toxin-antitoxin system RelE family toxin n=1 Tax=Hydrogenophaga sp. TaxID=1904254 RepID=UPI00271E7A6F|nr:type II toxin-antitoxin system RelE/ParE family toxin [Hydrogenophaga sp.]MDO8278131.1 type II toxin-antitoxin system RelE/ParE family toxin [Burkholderiaceae bacterium]MDO9030956.1 type II toxin-antitoxin system RelE/ParE family toxin [Hydrogenophaga sp.]
MDNTINWTKKAYKQLLKLDPQGGKAVTVAVRTELVNLSVARNVKKLIGHAYGYRLRVGGYRVLFDFDGVIRIVTVEEVRKRDEQTY